MLRWKHIQRMMTISVDTWEAQGQRTRTAQGYQVMYCYGQERVYQEDITFDKRFEREVEAEAELGTLLFVSQKHGH